jgi:2-methylcitrate dehydratase PrpD
MMARPLQSPSRTTAGPRHAAGRPPESEELTCALAERASSLTFDAIPADVVEGARQALLDWFGVTLGGSQADATTILLRRLPTVDPGDHRAVSVVGHELRLPALHGALVNGTSSHRLDFDDVNAVFLGHVSVALLGAALALAEQLDLNGEQLLTAYVAGYETACRIAAAVGPEPYVRGFHYTGTIGTFGAAASCARLLEMDAPRTATAFGLAATQAAGIKRNIGTMTKSFHAGKACENGLLSALLACDGFTAATDAIEAQQGFVALSGAICDSGGALADPPSGWYMRDNLFKYHASCFWTHSTIEGVLELIRLGQVGAEEVERIVVHVSELELGTCVVPEPSSGLEVKFSLAHLAAMVLLGRDTSVIADAAARDPEIIAARGKVILAEDGVPGQPTRVELTTRGGMKLEAAVDVNDPARDLAAQHRRLSQKFERLAQPVTGSPRTGELRQLISALDESISIRELMSLTRASPSAATKA